MKQITFTETGEVRPPKKGEWVMSDQGNLVRCVSHCDPVYPIYTMTESDVKTEEKVKKPSLLMINGKFVKS